MRGKGEKDKSYVDTTANGMYLISTYISTVHNINLQLSDFISYFLKILGSATWADDAILWIIVIAVGTVSISLR